MDFGIVVFTIATFERAVALARGVENVREPERPTVPLIDMLTAAVFAKAVKDEVEELRNRFYNFPWGFAGVEAQKLVNEAASAAHHFEFRTWEIVQSARALTPMPASVPSVRTGWAPFWVTAMNIAKEPFEILSGERPFQGSTFQFLHDAKFEFVLTSLPFIGEGVLIYEAVSGKSVVTGRNLSDAERVASGFAVILPFVLGAITRVAVRGAARALTISRRAVIIALEYKRVYRLLDAAKRVPKAIEIAVGLRSLPPEKFQEFRDLLRLVLSGRLTEARHLARLNYFFVRMHDNARLAQWLRIAQTELTYSAVGVQKLKGAKPKPEELEAMEALARASGEPVVALPERLPIEYPKGPQTPGAKYPDGIWQQELFELGVIKSQPVDSVINKIGKEGKQASTVYLYLGPKAKVTRSELLQNLHKVWARPSNMAINRIIIVDSAGMVVRARPRSFTLPQLWAIVRVGLESKNSLADIVAELQAERD